MDRLLSIIKKIIPTKIFRKIQPIYHYLMAWLAGFLYRWPSEKLIVIGVTGTFGKTTSVHLIAKALESAGYKVGYVSTTIFKVGEKEDLNDKRMTMPGRFFAQKMLSKMVKAGCQYAIAETTSEGIIQYRHRFINYDTIVFTGLYPEHIEAHGGFENYKKAKGKLFAHLSKCKTKHVDDKKNVVRAETEFKKIELTRIKKTIIANGDDKYADYFLNFKAEEKLKYEVGSKKSEVRSVNSEIQKITAHDAEVDAFGVSFEVDNTEFNLQLKGKFNIYNSLVAISVGLTQGIDLNQIKKELENVTGVPGRFEYINKNQDFIIIIDYAFEPQSVEKLYETINIVYPDLKNEKRKIIQVLGSAGGGRDVSRRPILGKLAGKKADVVIVTNEDPYDDDPQVIIDQIVAGAESAGKKLGKNLFKIEDRREAIKKALQLAKENDIVLITGKGCEQVICLAGGKKIKWDDREVAREELDNIKNIKPIPD